MKAHLIIFFSLILIGAQAGAQDGTTLKSAEVISAKAALEDMLVRRYSQELSSIISHENFSIGARIDLTVNDPKKNRVIQNQENFTDLDLGYLDADALFASYANFDPTRTNPLEKYSVKNVEFKVGIWPSLGNDIKKTVTRWVENRVKEEFGNIGKTQVNFIQDPNNILEVQPDLGQEGDAKDSPEGAKDEAGNPLVNDSLLKTKKPSWFEQLKEVQSFAGSLILALAILFGVLMWRLLMGSSASKTDSQSAINIQNKTELLEKEVEDKSLSAATPVAEFNPIFLEKIEYMSTQIKDLTPKISRDIDNLIAEWCNKGDEGLLQLASFAEISGSTLGSLNIPKEFKKKMADVFAKMHDLDDEKRCDILTKTYWDIVASLNLGTETLHRPFSFIGKSSVGTVSEVLLGNNSDIQTIVSLYMPDTMRKGYFGKLDLDKKIELLNNAAKLSTISQSGLEKIEKDIAGYFETTTNEAEVSLSLTLSKLVDSMTLIDACKALPKVEGPVIEKFKRTVPHVAFISEWKDNFIEMLIKRASNEEVITLIRIVPEIEDKVLNLVSPLAKKVIEDDLSRADTISVIEKEKHLTSLQNKFVGLISRGEVLLEDAFPELNDESKESVKLVA